MVTLIDPSDIKDGKIRCSKSFSVPTSGYDDHTIGIVVNNYYTRNSETDDDVIVIYQSSLTEFMTGGGYVTISSPGGTIPAEIGTKNNFGFNVKYNKKGKPQGHVNIIYRNGDNVYQIKSTAIISASVMPWTPVKPGTGSFTSKANLVDITNPLNPVGIASNANLEMVITDNGEPGSSDTIGVTLSDGKSNALLFSNNWNGAKTQQKVLTGGNLFIH